MESAKNQREVETRLKDALRYDRARVQLGKISRFGLMELSRQRLRPALAESAYIPCPRCHGIGHIRGTESSALHILRILQEEAMKENTAQIVAQVPVDVATFLLNEKRTEVMSIETRFKVNVLLVPNRHLETPNYTIQRLRHDDLNQSEPMPASFNLVERPEEPDVVAQMKEEAKEPRQEATWSKASRPDSRRPFRLRPWCSRNPSRLPQMAGLPRCSAGSKRSPRFPLRLRAATHRARAETDAATIASSATIAIATRIARAATPEVSAIRAATKIASAAPIVIARAKPVAKDVTNRVRRASAKVSARANAKPSQRIAARRRLPRERRVVTASAVSRATKGNVLRAKHVSNVNRASHVKPREPREGQREPRPPREPRTQPPASPVEAREPLAAVVNGDGAHRENDAASAQGDGAERNRRRRDRRRRGDRGDRPERVEQAEVGAVASASIESRAATPSQKRPRTRRCRRSPRKYRTQCQPRNRRCPAPGARSGAAATYVPPPAAPTEIAPAAAATPAAT